MDSVPVKVPEDIWSLARRAHIKSQIETDLLVGNFETVLRVIRTEGDEQAQVLNRQRPQHVSPYAFQALVSADKVSDEEVKYFYDLQQLYKALIENFGVSVRTTSAS